MVTSLRYIIHITVVLNFFTGSFADDNTTLRYGEALKNARDTLHDFFHMFHTCTRSTMAKEKFIIDDLQAYLFHPAKTTVGYAPKYKNNRKFFTNLIGTQEFHHMLEKDIDQMKQSFIEKLKFCDKIVMDLTMLRDMYDREYETAMI